MRISDWSSDVCSSDLLEALAFRPRLDLALSVNRVDGALRLKKIPIAVDDTPLRIRGTVGSSLYRSARAAGAPAKAVQAYLKALATKLSLDRDVSANRSEEHTSELQSLMRISYAVFCLKKKNKNNQ